MFSSWALAALATVPPKQCTAPSEIARELPSLYPTFGSNSPRKSIILEGKQHIGTRLPWEVLNLGSLGVIRLFCIFHHPRGPPGVGKLVNVVNHTAHMQSIFVPMYA